METNDKTANIQSADDFNVSDFLMKFIKSWPLFIVLTVFMISVAFVYLSYKIPVYQVSATLLLKDDKNNLDQTSNILESLDLFATQKVVANELVVIKSRDLLKDVVINLHLYAPISEEGRLKSVSGYVKSPVIVEVKNPIVLTPVTDKVYFKFDKSKNEVAVENGKHKLNEWFVMGSDSLRFIPNPKYIVPEVEKPLYFSLFTIKETVENYSANIEVASPDKQSTIIQLALKDEVTKRGEDILNELIRCYNKAGLQDKNALAANTLSFVEDRLRYVVADLDSVETALQQFKSQEGIVDISEQGKAFLGNVSINDQKLTEINLQLAVMDQVEKYVMSKDEKMAIAPATLGVTDPVLLELLSKLYEFEMQYERLKKTTAENNYIMTSLQDQIAKIKPNILQNIRNQRNNLVAGKSTLTNTSSQYTSVLKKIPQKEKQLLEISRQQSIKNNIYTFLLQKREETALSFASTVADSRTVENAQAFVQPVSPKKGIIYAGALAAALFIGVAIICLKELLNTAVEFRSDIEKLISWPVIGEIAADISGKAIIVNEGVRSVIAEQFRQVRSSLDYLGVNDNKKRVMVTSSITQEGKSFVATNLAVSLSLTGKKVALLEFDLRKPKLSNIFNIQSDSGISNFLIGKVDVQSIIKPIEDAPNLFLVPSGPIPPNPSELLLSNRMNTLFEYLEQQFDYIIIDTAPIIPVTDADILSKFSDATLYLVRNEYTPKSQLKRLEGISKVRGLKNVAVIFNGTKNKGLMSSRYGYSYGYGYTDNYVPKKSFIGQVFKMLLRNA